MNNSILNCIQRAHISEKSMRLSESVNQYVFFVSQKTTKEQVQKAISLHFGVEVEKVTTINCKGKKKVFKQRPGRRKHTKKVYVTLKEGQSIEILGAE